MSIVMNSADCVDLHHATEESNDLGEVELPSELQDAINYGNNQLQKGMSDLDCQVASSKILR